MKNYALNNGLTFFHPRDKKVLLRTMMLRSTSENKWMFVLQFFEDPKNEGLKLLEAVKLNFPQIVSIYYAHNTKGNDSIYDLDLILFHGKSSLTEKMPSVTSKGRTLSFKVGPKSFYQTNSEQAYVLYCEVLKMAKIKSGEVDYVNAHGTSTILGDKIELNAIAKLFNNSNNLHVSSTKSSIGHLLGAAGSVEAIFSILSIKDNIMPGTLNLENPIDSGNIKLIAKEPLEKMLKLL